MALVKCKECGSQVSSKAKACPSCGAKPQKAVGTFGGLIVIGIAIFIFSKMFGGTGSTGASTPAKPVDYCSDTTMAFVMSQSFVEKSLKAPSTADFPYITSDGVTVSKLPSCKFQVDAYVDSQNSFGAKIRTHYVAVLGPSADGKTWTAQSVKFK